MPRFARAWTPGPPWLSASTAAIAGDAARLMATTPVPSLDSARMPDMPGVFPAATAWSPGPLRLRTVKPVLLLAPLRVSKVVMSPLFDAPMIRLSPSAICRSYSFVHQVVTPDRTRSNLGGNDRGNVKQIEQRRQDSSLAVVFAPEGDG